MYVTVCIIILVILIIYIYESNCFYLWLTMVHKSSLASRSARQVVDQETMHRLEVARL